MNPTKDDDFTLPLLDHNYITIETFVDAVILAIC